MRLPSLGIWCCAEPHVPGNMGVASAIDWETGVWKVADPMVDHEQSRPKVFLSYARSDNSTARYLYDYLTLRDVDVAMDVSLPAGDSFQDIMADAIRDADCVVVLMSPAYFESRWSNLEVGQAFRYKTRVVPVLVENCEVPSPLNHLMALDWTDRDETSLGRLVDAVRSA